MLLVKPKFWVQSDDPNADLSEATWGYWTHLTEVHVQKLHKMASAKSGRSTGSLILFAQSLEMRMQTYQEALLDAYIKARKRGLSVFREPINQPIDHNMPIDKLVAWLEAVNVEPHEVMDITVTGANAKFIVPTFGEDGLVFPDDPNAAWWPNNHNIPQPKEWKIHTDLGESYLRSW